MSSPCRYTTPCSNPPGLKPGAQRLYTYRIFVPTCIFQSFLTRKRFNREHSYMLFYIVKL